MTVSGERVDENRALWAHASNRLTPGAVLIFRCECRDPLCRVFVALTLDEYATASFDGERTVVAVGHADLDAVVARTHRYHTAGQSLAPVSGTSGTTATAASTQ